MNPTDRQALLELREWCKKWDAWFASEDWFYLYIGHAKYRCMGDLGIYEPRLTIQELIDVDLSEEPKS